jgi:hypothetical protein
MAVPEKGTFAMASDNGLPKTPATPIRSDDRLAQATKGK